MDRGKMASPSEIQSNLEGLEYPASKSEMLDHAKMRGASEDILSTLEKLPEKSYDSPTDVSSELGGGM
jgi:hypothetical protein